MGVDRQRQRPGPGGGVVLIPAVRVVPAVPTFALDSGFWYAVTESQAPLLAVGSVVRVPLSGRRVRGFVVEVGERPATGLRPVAAVSLPNPIFDPGLLNTLTWAAQRYVAPLAVMLERAAPPNLTGEIPPHPLTGVPGLGRGPHPLDELAIASSQGLRRLPVALIERWTHLEWLETISRPIISQERSLMVVAATGEEAESLHRAASQVVGEERVALVSPHRSEAENTSAWCAAQVGGRLVVGTPRLAAWRVESLALAAVVEEGRRAMKDRQTPTVHVRDLLRTRTRLQHHNLVFVGPTPTLETLAAGATPLRARRRAWPPVEVADRGREPPTPGLLGHQALAAIRAVADRGGRVFVFAHRRGYAPAMRCARCATTRRCPNCGSRPEAAPTCARCGYELGPCTECGHDRFLPLGAGVGRVAEELRRLVGESVAVSPDRSTVAVGSEADLAGLDPVDLAVAVDADGLMLGSHFRAAEEALRVLARLAGRVGPGAERRALIQTSLPDHPVVMALRRGDPVGFLEAELEHRRRMGFPPAAELMIVEMRGTLPDQAEEALRAAAGEATVMGPAPGRTGRRWLIQARDLTRFRHDLRALVQRWRDGGATVRIDTDPLEL